MKYAKVVSLLISFFCFSAFAQKSDFQNPKAQEILKKAKQALSKKIDLSAAKSFTANYESSSRVAYNDKILEANGNNELNLSSFDKIRAKKSFQHSANNKPTNTEQQESILNGEKFFFNTNVFKIDGEKIDFNVKSNVDENQLKKMKESLRAEVFYLFFPITLDASWYFPMNFTYVGIAEAKDGKAEILELVSPNKKNYRLFFDAKTYLLLMMTESWTNKENKSFENRYFFSDYREKDGLLVATKIIVEKNGKVTEEKTIKDLKVNPTFKPNFFDVKE